MERLTPTPDQAAAIEKMLSEPTKAALQISDLGSGKAQPLSEPVLTPHGWVPMGSLRVGELVIGRNGFPTEVIGVFPQGEQDVYEVSFSDGASTRCTLDHLWTVLRNASRERGAKRYRVLTLREMLGDKKATWFVPMTDPVEFAPADKTKFDPYLIGVLLGDGGLSTQMVYLSTDPEIAESLNLPEGCSLVPSLEEDRSTCRFYRVRGLAPLLRKNTDLMGRKSDTKYVPKEYLYASVKDRISLLQGLFDTDGTPNGTAVEFGTVSAQLCEDVMFVVRSLGGTARVSTKIPNYTYKGEKREGKKFYRLRVCLPPEISPFNLRRKAAEWSPPSKYLPRRKIVSVVKVAHEQVQCIRVAAPDSLYVTKDFVVTHNTLMAVELALGMKAEQVLVVAPLNTFQTKKSWQTAFTRQGWGSGIYLITPATPENHAKLLAGEPGVYIVGREFFYLSATASPPKKKPDGTMTKGRAARWVWSKAKPDLMVVDEAHILNNRYGLMFEVAKTVKAGYRLAMSATPQGSKFDGIWAPCRWLWPQYPGPVDRSKNRWIAEWCEVESVVTGRNPMTGELTRVNKIVGERRPGAFLKTLPCVVKVEVEKKPYELYEVYCTLSAEHKAVWNEMAETSVAWLDDNPTVAKLPMEKRLRLRQMALGLPEINEAGEVGFAPDCESPKLNVAERIKARHPGEAILFVTDSAKFAEVAAERLGAKLFYGPTPKKAREKLLAGFGTEFQYMVCTYGAIAEGCFEGDVEVMTNNGFVRLDSLNGGEKILCQSDKESPQFRPYTKVEVPVEGELVQLNLQGSPLPCTKNHRFDFHPYRGEDGILSAEDISFRGGSIPANLSFAGCGSGELTPMERLYIATQADGSKYSSSAFSVGFNKQRKIDRFKWLLKESGVEYRELSLGANRWRARYSIDNVEAKENLFACFDIESMTAHKASEIISEMALWDGYAEPNGMIVYRSSNSRAVDFYEMVSAISGRSTKRVLVPPKNPEWSVMDTLYVFKSGRRYAQYGRRHGKSFPNKPFSGVTHCVNVGGRKCVFRKGGTVFVARNSDGLQHNCHVEVIFNPADSSVQNEQFSGRLNRIGQPADKVVRYRLLARDTLDDLHSGQSLEKVLRRRAELALANRT